MCVMEVVDSFIFCHATTNSGKPHLDSHSIDPMNTLVFSILHEITSIKVSYFGMLVSPLVGAMERPTVNDDHPPLGFCKCGVSLRS